MKQRNVTNEQLLKKIEELEGKLEQNKQVVPYIIPEQCYHRCYHRCHHDFYPFYPQWQSNITYGGNGTAMPYATTKGSTLIPVNAYDRL